MADIDTLNLSVRTEHVLRDRCGVTTTEALASLHGLRALAHRLGRLGVQEMRDAQLRLIGSTEDPIVTREQIFDSARTQMSAEVIEALGPSLGNAGWSVQAPGRWRLWLRDAGAVNELRLEAGAELVMLKLTQTEGDDDVGVLLLLEPARSVTDLVGAIVALGDNLQMKQLHAIADALLSEVARSWCDTRGGYIPLTPPAATAP